MRVVTVGGAAPSARAGSARKADGAGGRFTLVEAGETGGPASTAAARAAEPASPLLALQEVPDPTAGRRRAARRGHSLLDHLDAIRVGLIEGIIPAGRLDRLIELLRTARSESGGAEVEAVLDEIELRARVELAKLGHVPA
jgi:hypothetical protein